MVAAAGRYRSSGGGRHFPRPTDPVIARLSGGAGASLPRSKLLPSLLAAFFLVLAAPLARAQSRAASPVSAAARIEGTITVTIDSARLKHWGMPGATAAFVPDADQGPYASRIRDAAGAPELCAALEAASGKDSRIAIAAIEGDGNSEHRSGDEEMLSFALLIGDAASSPHGSLYVCSNPAIAMMSRGAYPRERFYRASDDHVVEWKSRPLTLHPGGVLPLRFSWNIDASTW